MTNWLRKIPRPDRETVRGLLGFWALYLVPGVIMGLASRDVWVFLVVAFAAPALLAVVAVLALINLALFLLGAFAACRVASWAYYRFLWDRFRFHWPGRAPAKKGIAKVENRSRTGWGLLADATAGFGLGLGFSAVICVPFLESEVLSFRLPAEAPPWLTGLGGIMLALGLGGAMLGLLLRVASNPLWELTREKEAELPPPADTEYF